ncbi:MAG: 6-phosphogluconolactonase [Thermoplasmata archaeon]
MGPRLDPQVRVFSDPVREADAAARHLTELARAAVRARGRFSWVLAGGRTPEALYRLLARRYRSRFPWARTEVFFGDERCVGPRNPESNYAMAREALLAHVPIPPRRVHRLRGELRPASLAAERYARRIESTAPGGDAPRFDVVLLGLGPDGHTASLFPGAPALRQRKRLVVAVPRAGHPPWVPRLSLTFPALASSREVLFLVEGAEKAAIVAKVWRAGARGDSRLPASLVRSAGPVVWLLDRAAAARLPRAALDPGGSAEEGRRRALA